MATKVILSPRNILQQPRMSRNHDFAATLLITNNRLNKGFAISCTKKKSSDDTALASDLAIAVQKIKTQSQRKEKAMRKSRELLFTELCQHLCMKEDEVNKKWSKMNEEEKWVLVNKFVDEWGVYFHPLSVRSVKEMVDEHLRDDKPSSVMFAGLQRIFRILTG